MVGKLFVANSPLKARPESPQDTARDPDTHFGAAVRWVVVLLAVPVADALQLGQLALQGRVCVTNGLRDNSLSHFGVTLACPNKAMSLVTGDLLPGIGFPVSALHRHNVREYALGFVAPQHDPL